MNDIMICLDILWMLTVASIGLGIVGIGLKVWNDIFC